MPMAESAFSVTYDGPALADGTMPVRELAPALLGLGDLFADASRLLYPDKPPVAVNIRATKEGSFFVHLFLEADKTWDLVVELFNSPAANALTNLKSVVLEAGGLIWFIKHVNKRHFKQQETGSEPGLITVTFDDNATIEVRAEVLRLFENIGVRKEAKLVVSPLTYEGIEIVKFSTEKPEPVSVTAADVPAFDLPTDADVLVDEERQMAVEIVTLSFEGNKWRLSLGHGQSTIRATIEDGDFLRRVGQGIESFRAGDVLMCLMRVIQTQRPTGLHSEYHLIKVIEHRPSPEQLNLMGDGDAT